MCGELVGISENLPQIRGNARSTAWTRNRSHVPDQGQGPLN